MSLPNHRQQAIALARHMPERAHREDLFSSVIKAEYEKARSKFPPMNSPHEGYGVIAEEFDEAWDEIKANNFNASCDEMIQVAAMALAYLVDLTDPANKRRS